MEIIIYSLISSLTVYGLHAHSVEEKMEKTLWNCKLEISETGRKNVMTVDEFSV